MLFAQGRYELALREFQLALADDPNDAMAHAFMALCLMQQKQYEPASRSAAQAIGAAPDLPFAHYVAASVFQERRRFKEAERAIGEAIRLDPYTAAFHGMAAMLRVAASDWNGALDRATGGLAIDPDDDMCRNARALALVKLGRVNNARTELESSLERNPENAFTHANLGWAALERGQRDQALESFREALRVDPNMEWARDGMIHSLKMRYPFYGLFLRYMLWMTRFSGRAQMGIVIGAYLGYRGIYEWSERSPEWRPWLMPLIVAYLLFAYLSWVARPITNLLLRLNRFGRAALDPNERHESNLVGAAIFGALASAGIYATTGSPTAFFAIICCAAMVIPLSRVFNNYGGWPRTVFVLYSVGMALLGLMVVVCVAAANHLSSERLAEFSNSLFGVFVIGVVLSAWIANGLGMVRPTR